MEQSDNNYILISVLVFMGSNIHVHINSAIFTNNLQLSTNELRIMDCNYKYIEEMMNNKKSFT